jgi:hypothetical protein
VSPPTPPDADPLPWALDEPEPTRLVALWPGAQPPMQTEVLAAFASDLDRPVEVIEDGLNEPDVLWCVVVELPLSDADDAREAIVWCEPTQPLEPGELDDPRAEACKWVVGLETTLDETDPLEDLGALMRLVGWSFDEVPAVLDVNAERWYPRAALEEFFREGAEPPPSVLWMIHLVEPDDAAGGEAWVHTHGLWRCGLPELELLEVPRPLARAGAELLNTIAACMLESMLPPAGEPLPVGPDLDVTVQPWAEVASFVTGPGGMDDRGDGPDNPHVGVRAVVCDVEPRGTYRPLWACPTGILEQIRGGDATVFMSSRETMRQARLARGAWTTLATAFEGLTAPLLRVDATPGTPNDEPAVRFLIKAGLPASPASEGDEGEREHVWFIVRRFDADRAEAELLNQPLFVRSLRKGDVTWIDRDVVTDWSVMTPAGSFGPAEATEMTQTVRRLASGGEPKP